MNTNPNPNTEPDAGANESAEVIGCARALGDATQDLCRATLTRPHLAPADVDVVLAHLATAAAAALPQAAHQLNEILDDARYSCGLTTETLTDTEDPDLAIDTARLHLDTLRQPVIALYRHLDAAHQQTAHISTGSDDMDSGTFAEVHAPRSISSGQPAEDREPPRTPSNKRGRGVSR